jgi:aryl-alcohol dehydrogenase-like predicted oxidoreductase
MKPVKLGRTGLEVSHLGFGALPIQRTQSPVAERIIFKAYENGVRFFDTARFYSDSEEKLGRALKDVRKDVVLATKTMATDRGGAKEQLSTSLQNLSTDYIDIMQLHNPDSLPDPNDPRSAYAALVEARKAGTVRHIGISNHRLSLARDAVLSGMFDTLQYPLSYLSTPKELELVELCREYNVGFIAMKALAGGLLTNIRAAYTFVSQFDNVVPIWGIQKESELNEFLALDIESPELTLDIATFISEDRRALGGSFCRGCGYCMPCPADIPIHWAARMPQLLRRAPSAAFLTPSWQEQMSRIEACTDCRSCESRCPYDLETRELLKAALKDYRSFL